MSCPCPCPPPSPRSYWRWLCRDLHPNGVRKMMEGAGRFSCTRSPRGGAASAIETGRTEEKPLALPASPQTASRCPQGFLPSLDITAHHGANGSAASPAVGCPGSRVSQDLQHLSVGTGTCGLGWARRSGVKCSGSTGCSGMRTLRSKPGAWYSGMVWILSFSKENQSNRNTCEMPQFSTQHSDLQCLLSARKILLAKGGTAWTSVPAFPKAHVYLPPGWPHLPACRACAPLCSSHPWSSAVPALGGSESRAGAQGCRSALPACTKGSPSALLFLWLPVLLCY